MTMAVVISGNPANFDIKIQVPWAFRPLITQGLALFSGIWYTGQKLLSIFFLHPFL